MVSLTAGLNQIVGIYSVKVHFNRHTISGYYHALTRMIMAFFDCYSHKTGCPLNCNKKFIIYYKELT